MTFLFKKILESPASIYDTSIIEDLDEYDILGYRTLPYFDILIFNNALNKLLLSNLKEKSFIQKLGEAQLDLISTINIDCIEFKNNYDSMSQLSLLPKEDVYKHYINNWGLKKEQVEKIINFDLKLANRLQEVLYDIIFVKFLDEEFAWEDRLYYEGRLQNDPIETLVNTKLVDIFDTMVMADGKNALLSNIFLDTITNIENTIFIQLEESEKVISNIIAILDISLEIIKYNLSYDKNILPDPKLLKEKYNQELAHEQLQRFQSLNKRNVKHLKLIK